jgi:hypothetical protein
MDPKQTMPESVIVWILKITILLQSLGLFFMLLKGSSVESLFFLDFGFEQATSKSLENSLAYLMLILGIAIFIQPKSYTMILFFIVSLGVSWVIQRQGGIPHANLTLPSHALRILTPIGLWILVKYRGDYSKAYSVLTLALSITFLTHGLEALSHHPRFIDYLFAFSTKFLNYNPRQSDAEFILIVIGVLDICMAILVLVKPKPIIFVWMAYWGFVTASARIVELGWGMYPEVLVRASHFLIPVVLLIIKSHLIDFKQPAVTNY